MKPRSYLSVAGGLILVGAILIRASALRISAARRTPLSGVLQSTGTPPSEVKARVATAYGHLPLQLEANEGQTDPQVKFLARGIGHTLFLTDRGAVLVLTKTDPPAKRAPEQHALTMELVLRMAFVGANPGSRVAGLDELPGKANYFIGNDPTQWHRNVPLYATVRYPDLYPGIDLRYSGDQRQVQYQFVAGPGADPKRIVLGWQGVDSVGVDTQGDLVLHTALGTVRQGKPVIYQEVDRARRAIAGGYVRTGEHQVGFAVAAYDASRPLVILSTLPFDGLPPTVAAATFAGSFDPTHFSVSPPR